MKTACSGTTGSGLAFGFGTAEPVVCQISGNSAEPRRQFFDIAEFAEPLPRRNESLLGEVFALLDVARDAVRDCRNEILVPSDDFAERFPISPQTGGVMVDFHARGRWSFVCLLYRHSRESGNPDGRRCSLDSCLRRNDGFLSTSMWSKMGKFDKKNGDFFVSTYPKKSRTARKKVSASRAVHTSLRNFLAPDLLVA